MRLGQRLGQRLRRHDAEFIHNLLHKSNNPKSIPPFPSPFHFRIPPSLRCVPAHVHTHWRVHDPSRRSSLRRHGGPDVEGGVRTGAVPKSPSINITLLLTPMGLPHVWQSTTLGI